MTIDSSGRVFVGTASNNRKFVVEQANSTAYSSTDFDKDYHLIKARNSTNDKSAGIQFSIGGNGEAAITATEVSDGATDLCFGTRGGGNRAERMRITSDGKFGFNTTNPDAFDSGANNFVILGNTSGTGNAGINIISGNDSYGNIYFGDATGVASYRGFIAYNHNGDTLRFGTNSSEKMRIDSSGKVLVATTSPSNYADRQLTVGDTSLSSSNIEIRCANNGFGGIAFSDSTASDVNSYRGTIEYGHSTDHMQFRTNAVERMRIDSSGSLLVGLTSTTLTHTIQGFGAANCAWFQGNTATTEIVGIYGGTGSGNNIFMKFLTDSVVTRGSIDYNRSAGQVRYNTTSDARLKSEIADSTTALNTLNNIRVRKYKWTETDYQVEHGFVAQELTEVVPEAVKVGDDGDEVTDTWAVDNSKLVPLLTKALQEAIAKIETLEQRLSDAGF
jgi:hypothetical protein